VIFSWLKFRPNHWAIFSRKKIHLAIFSRKKFAQRHKKSPKWRNFAQSGHPGKPFQPSLMFAGKARAYPRVEHLSVTSSVTWNQL
jgi:hypothetical protein